MNEIIERLNGNQAAAKAVEMIIKISSSFCVGAFPITPQTQVIEMLSKFCEGRKNAKFINLESEHSVMALCVSASQGGVRTFTATAGQGLALMHEMLHWASKAATPVVLANVNRALGPAWNICSDQGDSLSQRDTGILQFYCENSQEVFDTILLAFRVAEDNKVYLPAMVCYGGFNLSHSSELVKIPSEEMIKSFLPEFVPAYEISPKFPLTFGASSNPYNSSLMEKDRLRRMEGGLKVVSDGIYAFEKIFKRKISGVVDDETNSRALDAENICLTMGETSGAVKEAVEMLKDKSVGHYRIKLFRPFPKEKIRYLLNGKKRVIVFNNSAFPVLSEEVKAALYGASMPPTIIDKHIGVGGTDVSSDDVAEIIEEELSCRGPEKNTYLYSRWRMGKNKPLMPHLGAVRHTDMARECEDKLVTPGHRACAGCGAARPLEWALRILGRNTAVIIPASCWSIIGGPHPHSPTRVPTLHCAFETAAVTAQGVKIAKELKEEDVNVLAWAGDGGTFDIGLQSLSGAAERGANIIYICYDNEAYMNTGNQRSGATPLGAFTETESSKQRNKKDIMAIMAGHDIPYAATASIGYRDDFKEKVMKAKEFQKDGLCFIHLLCPCPTGWGFETDLTYQIARDAVDSGIFPLYEIIRGKYRTQKCNISLEAMERYLSSQRRFKNLNEKQKIEILKYVNAKIFRLKKLANLT